MRMKTHTLDYYRRLLGSQNHAMKRLDEHAKIMLFTRRQEVPPNSEAAACWYCVISGAVRRSAIRSDGRRQILDLMLPGDSFFVVNGQDDLAVEAIAEDTALASYSGQRIEQLAQRDTEFVRELRDVAFQELSRLQDQLLIIGGVTAVEKVSSFLLALASRSSGSKDQVVLPLTRYDIAEYLALSVETVCRSFTSLQQRGAIALAGKHTVKIINRNVLKGTTIARVPSPDSKLLIAPLSQKSANPRPVNSRNRPPRPDPTFSKTHSKSPVFEVRDFSEF